MTASSAANLHLSATLLAMLLGLAVPVLTQVVTKIHVSTSTRALLQAFLAVVAGAVSTAAAAGGDVNWQNYLFNIGVAWAVAVATHFGLLVPTGAANTIAQKTNRIGLGRANPHVLPTPRQVALLPPIEPRPTDAALLASAITNTTSPGQKP